MVPDSNQWDAIYRKEGRVFLEPFPRFNEVLEIFQQRGIRRVLDLGCGTGRHLVHLTKAGFQAYGLDYSPTGLSLARNWLVEEGLRAGLTQADMRASLPFHSASFDGLLSTQVIHHALIADIRKMISEIYRVLAPGGTAFLSVGGSKPDDKRYENERYEEVEPGTFVHLTGDEAGLPHHIFTEDELRQELGDFQIETLDLRAEGRVIAALVQKRA